MIRKAIIPAAGLGTRLLPITKEMPKEMLPLFIKGLNGQIYLKSLLQLVFEQLYDIGFQRFCFIIGRGKRAIEDHFTPDYECIEMLKNKGKENAAKDMKNFYKKIENSTIVWVNQPQPKGFGDAILKAQSFVGDEPFLVHAGDTYIISNENKHLKELIKFFEEFKSDIIFLIKKVEDAKKYGVIEGKEISENIYEIKRVIEKPEKPPTNLAIMPVYIFHPVIFKAIEVTSPGVGGEIQLTDAIQKIIDWKLKVYALGLNYNDIVLDIGSPETYWEALKLSYEYSIKE